MKISSGIKSAALVCANDNSLYYLTSSLVPFGKLYRYDLTTNTNNFVIDLGYSTPGDLTFYKGNIIFQATDSSFDNHNIMAYNPDNQTLSTVVCLDPNNLTTAYYGIMNVFNSSNGVNKIIASNQSNTLVEFDLENGTSAPLATLNTIQPIYGLASSTEYAASVLTGFQFNDVNCSLDITAMDSQREFLVHPNPTTGILEIETAFETGNTELFDMNGRLIIQQPLNRKFLDMGPLEQGIYILKIEALNKVFTSKIIKK